MKRKFISSKTVTAALSKNWVSFANLISLKTELSLALINNANPRCANIFANKDAHQSHCEMKNSLIFVELIMY